MINTLASTFRSSYGSHADVNNTDRALYHDALHAALGVGITLDDEVYLQGIEGQYQMSCLIVYLMNSSQSSLSSILNRAESCLKARTAAILGS